MSTWPTQQAACPFPGWVRGVLGVVGSSTLVVSPGMAQILPDSSLGTEASVVTPGATVQGAPAELINGGAARGANLFHSFIEFNVTAGQRVYFANPAGIETILSRVTGGNASAIDGLLGVDGGASLFLLNPNGVLFGPNARLDISGSFSTSTASSLLFADGSEFAAAPSATELLTVSVPLGVQFNHQPQGDITHRGALAVGPGQTLTLLGDTVRSSGSLVAPGGTVQVLGHQIQLVDQASVDVSGAGGGGTALIGGDYQGQGPIFTAQSTQVGPGVEILANALGSGDGGTVVVWADGVTTFAGRIAARGGLQGGDGGLVETSGLGSLTLGSSAVVDTQAIAGHMGTWLLDPPDLTVVASGGTATVVTGTNQPTTASTIDAGVVVNALNGANVVLQATNSITVDAAIDATGNALAGNLALDGPTVNLNQLITGTSLTGTATTVNVAATGSVLNGVDAVATGGTVNIAAGTFQEGQEIAIDRDITLAGAGAGSTILDGANNHAVLVISGGTVNISDLTIANGSNAVGYANPGGNVINDSTLTITNSIVTGGTAFSNFTYGNTSQGGGIFNSGTLTITDSTITGNTAQSVLYDGQGGGIFNSGTLTISNSTISNNNAQGSTFTAGGGIYNASTGTLEINGSTISGNAAGSSGGGIRNNGALTITGSSIFNNTAANGAGILDFGATSSISDSVISGNIASNLGGGIDKSGTLIVTNTQILNNTANFGGGINKRNSGTLTVLNSTISGNSANNGGGISTGGTAIIGTSIISDNSANGTGGGISHTYGTLSVDTSTISGNTSGTEGAGLAATSNFTLTNSTVNDNVASGGGGGIYNGTAADSTISTSTISGNTAQFDGGGIDNNGILSVTNSTISGNDSTIGGGGGIDNASGGLSIGSSLVSGNTDASGSFNILGSFTSDGNNLFGESGASGVDTPSLDASDRVPTEALDEILETTLANNGGFTQTLALVDGSPAIDAGNGTGADQRGVAVVNSIRDIGAFEFELIVPPVVPPPVAPPSVLPGPPQPIGLFPDPAAFFSPSQGGNDPDAEVADEVQGTTALLLALENGVDRIRLQAGCGANSTTASESAFTITGRGGLPPSPGQLVTADDVNVPWVINPDDSPAAAATSSSVDIPEALVQAQGLVVDTQGQAYLVSVDEATAAQHPRLALTIACAQALSE